jgi:hypothetical protein
MAADVDYSFHALADRAEHFRLRRNPGTTTLIGAVPERGAERNPPP